MKKDQKTQQEITKHDTENQRLSNKNLINKLVIK